ncbi:hypothetical protein MNBD_GAMMA11-404 [hydrothermal vent metagenome]|uniref:Uncharacterized protein n=1 Tax=hydrothermal vent metagenome TaxID=652676 RepID=A0A3B0XQA1_9ZZZZ
MDINHFEKRFFGKHWTRIKLLTKANTLQANTNWNIF